MKSLLLLTTPQKLTLHNHTIYTMTKSDLTTKTCTACEGHENAMTHEEAEKMLTHVTEWELTTNANAISKEYTFDTFTTALNAINTVGEIAEQEGHHPDITLYDYNNLRITLSTHAIGGLSENDFIVAAKIDQSLST